MLKTEGYENSELFMSLTPKNGVKGSKLYSYKPTNGNGDFVWSRALTAYRKNQEGVLELMGSNVPRIDYTNTCPELLIEKESENLILRSQEFDNATWTINGANVSVTTNSTIAPDGTLTADTATFTGFGYLYQEKNFTSITIGDVYIFSIYAKTSTQIIVFGGATPAGTDTYSFETLPNGWYRQILKRVFSVTTVGTIQLLPFGTNTSIIIWGAQLEKSEYATSYIPTTTTSVTRPKDVCYNKFNGYNDADWSVVMRVRLNNIGSSADEPLLALSDGTTDYYFAIYTDSNPKLHFTWYNNPDQDTYSTTDLSNGIVNVGVSFDSATADYIIVIDGTLFDSGILANIGAGLFGNFIRLDLGSVAGTGSPDKDGIIATQYFNTALTQSDLENLTA
jgi:hypothetical protein